MIQICIVISNIFPRAQKFKYIWSRGGRLTKNKSWEVDLNYFDREFLGIKIDTNHRGHDHAGVSVELMLCGYNFSVKMTDNRHWNYKISDWER